MSVKKNRRIIVSGGGTGGHIFPAISIAMAIQKEDPRVEILFVGATGKMEMTKVPQVGFKIKGIWISGIHRGKIVKNLLFPLKLVISLIQSLVILLRFNPEMAIGVGGFASGPLLFVASLLGKKIAIQEQNSFPGITNRLLAKKAHSIYVAYDEVEKYFQKSKIKKFGNPIRESITANAEKGQSLKNFGLKPEIKTLLIIGGSQGALSINIALTREVQKIADSGIQVIWQSGQNYFDTAKKLESEKICVTPFIKNMEEAYAAADVILTRAGASTVSELCVIGKPVIFVPLPSASEDHQSKNAMALVLKDAAILLADAQLDEALVKTVTDLFANEEQCKDLGANIKKMQVLDAAERIAKDLLSSKKENSGNREFFKERIKTVAI
jgi:UDP-N-acetylglucosamine--N-acetylmuramyl-(pentapeptide) pyrophosphoryl-undecaprenol N-acetylglucosamine transferase